MLEISQKIKVSELQAMANQQFQTLVKAVVDIEKEIMVVDADLHSDEEAALVAKGSLRHNLWGINLHPDQYGTSNFIEYDSMINVKPFDHNLSRDVVDPKIRTKIKKIVEKLVDNE